MPLIQGTALTDFTGGLNLETDTFKLALNELPDVLNMELNKRGGLQLRRGISNHAVAHASRITSMWMYIDSTGTARLMDTTTTNGTVRYYNGTAWVTTNLGTVNMGAGIPTRAATFKDRVYMQSGSVDPWRWNGSSNAVQLTTFAFNNDLENPTSAASTGEMPRAKLICSWMGSMWVAQTTESGTLHPNRVRWSHPNFPEDWHQDHYIDVDPGKDNDGITALVPLEDRLLVFKRSSIHVIYGAPPTGVGVRSLTYEVGALTQDAVVATDIGVYFYDPNEGVYLIQDKGPIWQFEPLYHAHRDGRISTTTADEVMIGWGNRRLWLSMPYEGSSERDAIFVLDPQFGRKGSGAWTRYDTNAVLGPFLEWTPPLGEHQFLAAAAYDAGTEGEVVALDQPTSVDTYDMALADEHIESRFRTSWVDLGEPYRQKRWKRPEIVLQSGTEADIDVEAYSDYDFGTARRRFTLTASASGNSMVWDSDNWDEANWAADTTLLNKIERGSPLGNGRSVALHFIGPITDVEWGVNQVAFKYIPRKIRN